jgi:hypothetical protein
MSEDPPTRLKRFSSDGRRDLVQSERLVREVIRAQFHRLERINASSSTIRIVALDMSVLLQP